MIETLIDNAIRQFNMLDCSSLLVGFSGGADSCALLDVLHNLCKSRNILLYALHVNHMIRGEEAERDRIFCSRFCDERNIPLTVIKKDIPALAKKSGKGLEECARDFRYSCFDEFCKKNHIDRIATAHNANDNAETVIFNLARGSGLRGLCGIPPIRDNIIRPLIYCQKEEIIEYCRQKGIEYMQDSTNDSVEYTRNYIRHIITPELRRINTDAIGAISKNSTLLRADLSALDSISQKYKGATESELLSLPDAIITRVLLLRYADSGFDPSKLEQKHILSIIKLFKSGKTSDMISLPGKSEAIRRKEGITFRAKTEKPKRIEQIFHLHYGTNPLPMLNCLIKISKQQTSNKERTINNQFSLRNLSAVPEHKNTVRNKSKNEKVNTSNCFLPSIEKRKYKYIKKCKNVYKLSLKIDIVFDNIDSLRYFYCRARADGDSYCFGGMTRSVKKLLWQLKIPSEQRVNYPVLCDSEGIVFLPGYPVRDSLKNKNGEKYTVCIYKM